MPQRNIQQRIGPSLISGLDYWTRLLDSQKQPLEGKGTAMHRAKTLSHMACSSVVVAHLECSLVFITGCFVLWEPRRGYISTPPSSVHAHYQLQIHMLQNFAQENALGLNQVKCEVLIGSAIVRDVYTRQQIDSPSELTLERRLSFWVRILTATEGHLKQLCMVARVELDLESFRILLPISP